MKKIACISLLAFLALWLVHKPLQAEFLQSWQQDYSRQTVRDAASSPHVGQRLVEAARSQIGVTTEYDSSYARIAYPNGDVPLQRGVCTDVVVRAYRSLGVDLQQLVHEDIARSPEVYPKLWKNRAIDANIDHRRVPNLMVFFKRHAVALPIVSDATQYRPGEVIVWDLGYGRTHIGIVADSTGGIIHNIAWGARYERALHQYKIIGRFQFSPSHSV